ncbi:MAG: FtsQ-type POTRA domain-containing protein [Cyanobacteria bacterium P01_D01_bin.105]
MAPKRNAPSLQTLSQRRQYLRDKRRYTFYKTVWRAIAIFALAAGSIRLATSPVWNLSNESQISVSDNQILSDENIQALLPINYPQSLLRVTPEALADRLETHPPIESATVNRRLIPPGLHVRVRERQPVAVVIPDTTQPLKSIPDRPVPFEEPGLIDAEGYWMPRNSFQKLGVEASPNSAAMPALVLKGMRAKHKADWRKMYQSIQTSPVKITAVDWTKPSNLVLQSEFGEVRLGPYGRTFDNQLAALDQIRNLDTKVNPERVAYIDLQDPSNPVIQILQATSGTPGLP